MSTTKIIGLALAAYGLAEGKLLIAAGGALLWWYAGRTPAPTPVAASLQLWDGTQFQLLAQPEGFVVTPAPSIATLQLP